jgi:SAM-dependent methyltransferase
MPAVHHPPSHRPNASKRISPSSFVIECLLATVPIPGAQALDLPVGTGRHSGPILDAGYRLTVADLDPDLVAASKGRLSDTGHDVTGLTLDASKPLTIEDGRMALVVVVDFVDERLLSGISRIINPGGFFIYETYAARGQNWRQLLSPGRTEELLENFEILRVIRKQTGPDEDLRESIKLFARKL